MIQNKGIDVDVQKQVNQYKVNIKYNSQIYYLGKWSAKKTFIFQALLMKLGEYFKYTYEFKWKGSVISHQQY